MAAQSRVGLAAVATIAALLLAACATPTPEGPAGRDDAVKTREPTSAPTPRPDPDATAAAADEQAVRPDAIALHADGIRLVDAAGEVIEAVTWSSESETIVAALADAIGEEPRVTEYPGDPHSGPGPEYRWNGIRIAFLGGRQPADQAGMHPSANVWITTPSVNGIRLVGADGTQIGDPTAGHPKIHSTSQLEGGTEYRLVLEELTVSTEEIPDHPRDPPYTHEVVASGGDTVTLIYAPADNYRP